MRRHDCNQCGPATPAKRKAPVTNLDWIAGMMSALAIAALFWAAVAFA
jgi:hypothetical protein